MSAGARRNWTSVALVFGMLVLMACSIPFLTRSLRAETDSRPTLQVEFLADSARLIARTTTSCDAKGCAESYRFQWAATAATRTVTKASVVDTFYVPRPTVGDSLMVSVSVTAIRRGISSAPRTATTWVRNPDAAPPRVDSIVIDTLALQAEAAFRDTFPTFEVRMSTGRLGMAIGESPQLCVLSKNHYTGEATLMIPIVIDSVRAAQIESVCEPARVAYQSEVSG